MACVVNVMGMNPDNKTIHKYLGKDECKQLINRKSVDFEGKITVEFKCSCGYHEKHINITSNEALFFAKEFCAEHSLPDYTAEVPAFFEFFRAIQKDERWDDFACEKLEGVCIYVEFSETSKPPEWISINPKFIDPKTLTRLWCEFIKEDA